MGEILSAETSGFLLFIASGSLLIYLVFRIVGPVRPSKTLPLPPGPNPLPIFGNIFELPKELSWLKYHEWSKTYGAWHYLLQFASDQSSITAGDVMHLQIPAQPTIVVNSADVAFDLLDRRSAIYSSRPSSVMDTL